MTFREWLRQYREAPVEYKISIGVVGTVVLFLFVGIPLLLGAKGIHVGAVELAKKDGSPRSKRRMVIGLISFLFVSKTVAGEIGLIKRLLDGEELL